MKNLKKLFLLLIILVFISILTFTQYKTRTYLTYEYLATSIDTLETRVTQNELATENFVVYLCSSNIYF